MAMDCELTFIYEIYTDRLLEQHIHKLELLEFYYTIKSNMEIALDQPDTHKI